MTESSHPNAYIARRLWEAAARADVAALYDLYAPDIVARMHGRSPIAGEVKGVRDVIEYSARAAELVDDLRLELIDIFASDRGAVIHYRIDAERGHDRLDDQALLMIRIKDGVIVRTDAAPFDQARHDAFWRVH